MKTFGLARFAPEAHSGFNPLQQCVKVSPRCRTRPIEAILGSFAINLNGGTSGG